jgi:hypothetical protein
MELRDVDAPTFSPEEYAVPGLPPQVTTRHRPGVCVDWEEIRKELPQTTGDTGLLAEVWGNTDALGNMFIWQCLLSF